MAGKCQKFAVIISFLFCCHRLDNVLELLLVEFIINTRIFINFRLYKIKGIFL